MTGNPIIRVQIAEDHEIVRTGFRYLVDNERDMEVVCESAHGIEACRHYGQYLPDVLVMDISMPGMHGLEAIRRIQHHHPGARILVLSMHSGVVAERIMQQGASGFICKKSSARELVVAIRRIMAGERYLDADTEAQLSSAWKKTLPSPLSHREMEICMHLADGQSVSNIAEQMHLSKKTVYTYREHIMLKLGVASVVELTKLITVLGIQSVC